MRISGGCDGDIAECAQESRLLIGGVVDCSTPDIALWKGLHVQAGHDTEVVAATFKRPEDIGIGALCDFTDGAIGEDGLLYHSSTLSFSKKKQVPVQKGSRSQGQIDKTYLERKHIVTCKPVSGREVRNPTTQRQASNTNVLNSASYHAQPVSLQLGVHIQPPIPRSQAHLALVRTQRNLVKIGQVNGNTTLDVGRASEGSMSTSLHSKWA